MALVALLVSTCSPVGCAQGSGAGESAKAVVGATPSGTADAISHLGPPPAEDLAAWRKAEMAVRRIPTRALRKVGTILFADPAESIPAPGGSSQGFSTDDRGRIGAISALGVGVDGRIYVLDGTTDSMHVFDDAGRQVSPESPRKSAKANPPKAGGYHSIGKIRIGPDGDTWVRRRNADGESDSTMPYIHRDPSGQPIGEETREFLVRSMPQPGGRRSWLVANGKIELVDDKGSVSRSIDWPGEPDSFGWAVAVASDGSLAVVALRHHPGTGWDSWDEYAVLYSPLGDKLTEWPLSFKSLAYPKVAFDGMHLAFVVPEDFASGHETVVVTDTKGRPLFRVSPEPWTGRFFFLLRLPEGEELWIFNDGAMTRYAMPE